MCSPILRSRSPVNYFSIRYTLTFLLRLVYKTVVYADFYAEVLKFNSDPGRIRRVWENKVGITQIQLFSPLQTSSNLVSKHWFYQIRNVLITGKRVHCSEVEISARQIITHRKVSSAPSSSSTSPSGRIWVTQPLPSQLSFNSDSFFCSSSLQHHKFCCYCALSIYLSE